MPNGPGGPHRRPAPVMEDGSIQNMLSGYLAQEGVPFSFDVYDKLKPSQAAIGSGLLHTLSWARRWLAVCPEAQLSSKQYTVALDTLVQGGALARFPSIHEVWERMNPFDPKQRRFWAQRQCGKCVVVLYHLRRLRTASVKFEQAVTSLTPNSRSQLEEVLKLIVVPPPKKNQQVLTLDLLRASHHTS